MLTAGEHVWRAQFLVLYRTSILAYTSKILQGSIHSMTLSESVGTIIYTEPGEPIVAATVSRDTAIAAVPCVRPSCNWK